MADSSGKKTMQEMLTDIANGNTGSGFARNQLLTLAYTMTPAYALMQINVPRTYNPLPDEYVDVVDWNNEYVLDSGIFETDMANGLITAKVPMVIAAQVNLTLDAPQSTEFSLNLNWSSLTEPIYQQAADGKDRIDYVFLTGMFDVLAGETVSIQIKSLGGSTKNIDLNAALLLLDYRPRVIPEGGDDVYGRKNMFPPDEWSPPPRK